MKGKRVTPEARREFLRSVMLGSCVVGVSMLGWLPVAQSHAPRLRPPGALDERDFLAACIKCGQCVQVCPVEAIFLADVDEGFGVGVPYIVARDQACDFSCDAIQCILACPTGALSQELSKPDQTEMGFARMVPELLDSCLARQGLGFKGVARDKGLHRYMAVDRWTPINIADHPYDLELCDLCVRECPIKDAISLQPLERDHLAPAAIEAAAKPAEPAPGEGQTIADPADKRRTPVVHDKCVGCGMCEMICPVAPAPIVIDARVRPPKMRTS